MQNNKAVLIHISDIHLADESLDLPYLWKTQGLFTKRHLGWLNYKLRRKNPNKNQITTRVIDYLHSTPWDYLVISGDLTNLALEREFQNVSQLLKPLIKKGKTIISPGNHDRYVPIGLNGDLLAKYFPDCFPFEDKSQTDKTAAFLEINKQTVLINLNLSVPRSMISSRGKILTDLEKCHEVLNHIYPDHLKIVVGHYPAFLPSNQHENYRHSLANKQKLEQFLIDSKIDIYLHGHIHKTWNFKPRADQSLICVNSGGSFQPFNNPWSGFHRICIENKQINIEKINLEAI